MPRPRLAPLGPIAVALALALALDPGFAAAKPCAAFAYEVFTLAPPIVYEGHQVVAAPPALAAVDQLMNSRDEGRGALVWEAASARGAVFRLDRAYTPTPMVDAAIRERSGRTIDTGCGAPRPFRPLRPGRYDYVQIAGEGERALVGAELLVAPGRDVVELRARVGGRDLRAVYPVTCARPEDDPAAGCAPSERSAADLDTVPTDHLDREGAPMTWEARERRLKVQAGVSWSFVGLSILSTTPTIIVLSSCARNGCFEEYASVINLPISALLFVGSIIPAAIYTARLREHRRSGPPGARVELLRGGLGVRF